ncbi:MAG: PhoU domain-containing protein [Planctomycetota bacterium]
MSAAPLSSAVADNLRFLALEARDQLQRTRRYLAAPTDDLAQAVAAREDYIDNLRRTIQRKVFGPGVADDPVGRRVAFAADRVAGALERLADHCPSLIRQVGYLEEEDALAQLELDAFFEPLLEGVSKCAGALFRLDARAAVRICRAEARLDELYAAGLAQVLDELEGGEHPHTQLTLVFVLRHLEQMGDALLDAGEAILSACLGESIKADRLWALGELGELDEVALREVAQTRSGARVHALSAEAGAGAGAGAGAEEGRRAPVIVKDGALEKLEAEREGNARWRALDPELAPAALEFQAQGNEGAIVYEYAAGRTFEDVVLLGDEAEVARAWRRLAETLRWVWAQTREAGPAAADFVGQLERRLPAIYGVHPGFRSSGQRLGGLELPALEELLAQVSARTAGLEAPFRVCVHGDLNLDNVLYDAAADRVRFLDLHRTHAGDYVEDASVLLVSLLRLQSGARPLRARLVASARGLLAFWREVAATEGDEGFEARLGLGLARSFATSTRFVLAPQGARGLFLRARYLLERLLRGDPRAFRLPEEILDV